ncbi:ATP-binding cassette domain-containing protein [Candidatus Harpocratesius sp.]
MENNQLTEKKIEEYSAPIRLEEVSFSYNDNNENKFILKNLTWSVNRGDFNLIFGPSGSGKTTFLYLLGGLLLPTNGKIYLFNNQIFHKGSFHQYHLRKKIGFIFQNIYLPDMFKVNEYMKFVSNLYELPINEIDQNIITTSKKLKIEHLLDKKTTQLSGGERKSVALALIHICKNPLILLDEPTGSIDYNAKQTFWESLRELNKMGTTIVAVSHDKEIFKYAKKIFILKDGNLKEFPKNA